MRKEFRISLPNKPGQLARVAENLGLQGVNILAVAAIGAANPVIALVVDLEDKTRKVLKKLRLRFQEVELLTVDVPHRPAQLAAFAKKMGDAKINIESIYLLEKSKGKVKVALTVSDLNKAKQKLDL